MHVYDPVEIEMVLRRYAEQRAARPTRVVPRVGWFGRLWRSFVERPAELPVISTRVRPPRGAPVPVPVTVERERAGGVGSFAGARRRASSAAPRGGVRPGDEAVALGGGAGEPCR